MIWPAIMAQNISNADSPMLGIGKIAVAKKDSLAPTIIRLPGTKIMIPWMIYTSAGTLRILPAASPYRVISIVLIHVPTTQSEVNQ